MVLFLFIFIFIFIILDEDTLHLTLLYFTSLQYDTIKINRYIRKCISEKDISWFPMSTALSLKRGTNVEDGNTANFIRSKLLESEGRLVNLLKTFNSDILAHLGEFTKAIQNAELKAGSSGINIDEASIWSGDNISEDKLDKVTVLSDDDDMSELSSVGGL